MYRGMRVGAVVPARDEEGAIGGAVAGLLALRDNAGQPLIDDCVVCDNGSRDATGAHARRAGARVVEQHRPGYGLACLTALGALRQVAVVLFMDGDGAFKAEQARGLLAAIADGADLAIGARPLGVVQAGALSLPQRVGNRVAVWLIRRLWGRRVTDLGPYRAVRMDALRRIAMRDRAYGWTVEMQVKAIAFGLRVVEVPVDTLRRRCGKSKVGGTLRGVVGAALGILSTIAALRWRLRDARARACGQDNERD